MLKQWRVWLTCLTFLFQSIANAAPATPGTQSISALDAIFSSFSQIDTYQEFASYLVLDATPTDEAFFNKYFKAATGNFPKITHNENRFSIEGIKGEITVDEGSPITLRVGTDAFTFNPETSVEENVTRAEAWLAKFSGQKSTKARLLIPEAQAQVLPILLLVGGIIYAVSAAYYAWKCSKLENPHTAKEWGSCGLKGLAQPFLNLANTFKTFGNSSIGCKMLPDKVVCPSETERKTLTITHRCPGGRRETQTIYYNSKGKAEKVVVKLNSEKQTDQFYEAGRLTFDTNAPNFRISSAIPAKGAKVTNPRGEHLDEMARNFEEVDRSCRHPSMAKRVETNIEGFFGKMFGHPLTKEEVRKRRAEEEATYR